MWTKENRGRYDRSRLRYPSDLTDEEWALVEPQIASAKRGGNKRTVDVREVVNGLMYVLSSGCQWRAIPKDLPPRSTVHGYFDLWTWDGTLDRIHHTLYVQCRELPTENPARVQPSSTVKASRAQKKGGVD
jgi:transposase